MKLPWTALTSRGAQLPRADKRGCGGSLALGLLLEELYGRQAEGFREPIERSQRHVPLCALNRSDVGSMKAALFGESLLGEARFQSKSPKVLREDRGQIARVPHEQYGVPGDDFASTD